MAGTALIPASVASRLGATLLDDNKTHTLRMEIRSESSSRLYTVAMRKATQKWECSCMGWIRHRKCKHLQAMVPVLEHALRNAPKQIGGLI